jgi:hypothetical protein
MESYWMFFLEWIFRRFSFFTIESNRVTMHETTCHYNTERIRSCIHICSGTKPACWFPNLLPIDLGSWTMSGCSVFCRLLVGPFCTTICHNILANRLVFFCHSVFAFAIFHSNANISLYSGNFHTHSTYKMFRIVGTVRKK